MPSSYTPNKDLEMPASGSYNNAWAAPLNAVIDEVDTSLGGNTAINVTGIPTGSYALAVNQYVPPNIVFSGTIIAPLAYVLPAGVGGIWTIYNNTSGGFNLTFAVSGGGSIVVQQGQRSLVVSDGTNVQLADTAAAAQAIATAESFATAADVTVLASAESFASAAAATAQSNAETFASDGSNISSGLVPAANVPLIGNLSGVTIQADPGGTPSGSPGDMFFFY